MIDQRGQALQRPQCRHSVRIAISVLGWISNKCLGLIDRIDAITQVSIGATGTLLGIQPSTDREFRDVVVNVRELAVALGCTPHRHVRMKYFAYISFGTTIADSRSARCYLTASTADRMSGTSLRVT